MESMTDAFMTAAVLAAVAHGKTVITGVANQRVKECNRIEVFPQPSTKPLSTSELTERGLAIEQNHEPQTFSHKRECRQTLNFRPWT